MSIQAVAELINFDKKTVWQILHNNFNVKKVYSNMVARLLNPEHKEIQMNIWADIFKTLKMTQTL